MHYRDIEKIKKYNICKVEQDLPHAKALVIISNYYYSYDE